MELDAYEERFITNKLTSAGNAWEFQKSVILSLIEHFESAKRKNERDLKPMLDSDLIPWLTEYVRRSISFEKLYAHFDKVLSSESSGIGLVEATHVFAPLLLQELEGTIKRGIRVIAFVAGLEAEKSMDWKVHQRRTKYLKDAIREARRCLPSSDTLVGLLDGLDHPDSEFRASVIRNSIGHSDYHFIIPTDATPLDRRITVIFLARDESGEVISSHPIAAIDLLGLFFATVDLAKLVNVGLHLGIRRVTGEPP